MAIASTAPRVFEPEGDPDVRAEPLGPQFWRRIPEVLATDPMIGPTDLWVFLQFLCSLGIREFSGTISQRDLAARCRLTDRTVRTSLGRLERQGYLVIERGRVGEVNLIRLGFEFQSVLVLQPEAPIATATPRRRRARRKQGSAIQPSEQRKLVSSDRRKQGSSTPYCLLDGLEETTTTESALDPAARGVGEDNRSSSFSSPSDRGPGPEGPPEAPGSPQDDRREESAETPDSPAPAPPWASRAIAKIAAAWPEAPLLDRELWRRKLQSIWRSSAKEADGAPPSHGECGRVAALALEYASLRRGKLKNPADPVGYLVPVLARWSSSGFTSAEIEAEVRALRPATKPKPEDRPRPRREDAPPEVRKARAEYLRAMVRDPAGAEDAGRRLAELEAAWEARKEDRTGGVSACPLAGSELQTGGRPCTRELSTRACSGQANPS